MKRLGIIALLSLIACTSYAADNSAITNYCVSLQFKDGSMGGVAIPWISDSRNPEYCEKAVIGLQLGDTNDIWIISSDAIPIVATNHIGQSFTLPMK